MNYQDSSGKGISIGDRVRFRGYVYTIDSFQPGEGRSGIATVGFREPSHLLEVPDEWSVDLMPADTPLGKVPTPEDLLLAELKKPGARPVFLTGAGISLASGIPTFRGNDPDAVWSKDVLEMATFDFFQGNPVESWAWYVERFISHRDAKPNAAHVALAAIGFEIPETIVVTQNVDGLHHLAGQQNLIEIHGASRFVRCTNNGRCSYAAPRGTLPFDMSMVEGFTQDPQEFGMRNRFSNLPFCPACGNILRPHVLWFDEMYLDHEDYGMERAHEATLEWTVLVFIGTSHSVGITEIALEAALENGIPIFNIDPIRESVFDEIMDIPAAAEEVLPRLLEALQ